MNGRKTELDVIRIIACFFVVVIHVSGYGMEAMEPTTFNWMIRNLVVCAVRCAVPVFFMLSGILFMEKDLTIKVLYKKYVARIMIAWGIWSAFYAAIDYVARMKTGEASLKYFFSQFLTGHYHMWFLMALLTAYVMLPILQKLVRTCSPFEVKYLGIVGLIGVIGKETLDPLLKGTAWDNIWNNLGMADVPKGVIYFVLGYYLYKNRDVLLNGLFSAGKCMVFYVLSVMVMAGTNMICAYLSGQNSAVASGYLNLCVVVSSSALFLLLIQKISVLKFSERQIQRIRKISELTFGIYLIHTFFIEQVYRRAGLTQEQFPVLISIVLFSVSTFCLSVVAVWCIRRIPVIGKWVA